MADVSLIPDEQKKRSLSRAASGKEKESKLDRSAKIGIVLLIIFVIAGGTLYMWRQSLELEREDLRAQLTQVKGQRDAALENRVATLNTLLGSFDDVVSNHRHWSRFLTILEEQVVPGIIFTEFEGRYETATAALRGLSPDYTRFAQQVKALEAVENVEQVNVSSVGLNREGEVEFAAQVIFDRNLLTGT